jgi:hypothetical protein
VTQRPTDVAIVRSKPRGSLLLDAEDLARLGHRFTDQYPFEFTGSPLNSAFTAWRGLWPRVVNHDPPLLTQNKL